MAYGIETINSVMGGYGFDSTQIISREQVPNVTNLVENGVIPQERYNGYRVWINVGGFDKTTAIIGSLNQPVDLAFGSTYTSLVNIAGDSGLGALAQVLGVGSARYKFTTARFWQSSKPLTITLDITVTEDDYVSLGAGTPEQSVGKIINFIHKLGVISLPSEADVGEKGINFTGMNPPGPEPYSLSGWAGKSAEEVGNLVKTARKGFTLDKNGEDIGSASGHRIMVKVMDFLFFDWMQVESVKVSFSPTFVDYSNQVASFSDILKSWIASNVQTDAKTKTSQTGGSKQYDEVLKKAGEADENGKIGKIVRPYYAKFSIQMSTMYDLTIEDLKRIITFNEGARLTN